MASAKVARFGAVAAALFVAQLILGSRPAIAAPGDVIADVATPEGAVLGKGIAFDGRYLYYTHYNGTVLYRIDVPPAGGPTDATGQVAFPITGAPSGINALSYDATRDAIWAAGGDGVSIYLLSKTGAATLAFGIDPATDRPDNCKVGCSQEINGLAYDAADDTIWYSPDATMRVYHYHSYADQSGTALLVDGTPYVDVDVPPNDMTPECGYDNNSGVAVGGDHLFLAGGGCRYLFEYTKTGTKLGYIQYAYGDQSPWELECDNLSYPVPVIWAKDGWDGHIRAIEQPPGGGCTYGGGPSPAPPPPSAVHDLKVAAPATLTAGRPFSLTVTAETASGDPVATYTGSVHFAASDPNAVLPQDSTLAGGQGTFTATLFRAGAQALTVSDLPNHLSTTVAVSITSQPAVRLALSAPSGATAGSDFTFTVSARDQFDNVDTQYAGTVAFSSSDNGSGAALPPQAALANGQSVFRATLVTAGHQTIAANDTGNATIAGSAGIDVQPGAAAIMTLDAPGSAGVNQPFTVTVTLKDSFGNVATGYAGTVRFSTTDISPLAKMPPNYTFTAQDRGTRAFSVTLQTPPQQRITVTDVVNGSLTATSPPISVRLLLL
jgi:hypothetical protein